MLNPKIETALNNQITKEEFSSRLYLSMAIWCEVNGYPGAADFLYKHSDEERMHLMKMIHYVNNRRGFAHLFAIEEPQSEYASLLDVFTQVLKHEESITEYINDIYGLTVEERDYSTGNFLQWFITEQIEEESLISTILNKIKLVGNDKAGMFHIDKELSEMSIKNTGVE